LTHAREHGPRSRFHRSPPPALTNLPSPARGRKYRRLRIASGTAARGQCQGFDAGYALRESGRGRLRNLLQSRKPDCICGSKLTLVATSLVRTDQQRSLEGSITESGSMAYSNLNSGATPGYAKAAPARRGHGGERGNVGTLRTRGRRQVSGTSRSLLERRSGSGTEALHARPQSNGCVTRALRS
jgi:hypothetical protein